MKVDGTAYVRFDIEVQVQLPEGLEFESEDSDQLTHECSERAIEAAVAGFPDSLSLYLDGEREPPAKLYFDVSYIDVQETRGEED